METDPFSRALAALASPAVDPNARREAEAFVTAAGEDPAVVLALLRHLEPASAVAPETRHLAAVLLATSAGKHWRALDDHSRRATQSGVLTALAHAEDPATLRALAHAADVVAQSSTTTSTPWDDLLPSLSEAARSPKDAHREAASLLLGNLVESMGEHLSAHHEALVDLFVAATAETAETICPHETPPRRRARRAALGALAQLASALGASGDFPKVARLVPRIIERCLHAAMEYSKRIQTKSDQTAGRMIRDHRGVAAALRALAAAVAVDADAVFGPDLRLLCPAAETALAVATRGHVGGGSDVYDIADEDLDEDLDDARAAAFEALEALASTHSGALDEPVPAAAAAAAAAGASAKDAPRTIAAMLLPPLCAAARGEDAVSSRRYKEHDATDDSETRGVAAAARAALRQCALRFPPSAVLPHALGPVADAGARGVAPSAGALGAFAVVVEGCAHDVVDDEASVKQVLTALRLGVESATRRRRARRRRRRRSSPSTRATRWRRSTARRRHRCCASRLRRRSRRRRRNVCSPTETWRASREPRTRRPSPLWRTAATRRCTRRRSALSPPRWWAARAPRDARARARACRRRSPRWSPRRPRGSSRTRRRRCARWRRSPARRVATERAKRRRTRFARGRSPRWRRWFRRRASSAGSRRPSWTRRREGFPTPM